jgi:protein TonB
LHATIALRLVLDESGRVGELRFLRPASTSFRSTPGRGVNLGSLGPAARTSHVLEPFVRVATAAVRQWQYETPAAAPLAFDIALEFHPDAETELVAHGLTTRGTFSVGSTGTFTIGPASADPPPGWPPAARLGPNHLPPRAVTRVRPYYPIAAAAEGVQGYVLLEARIGVDGRVTHARVVESIPVLDAAALEAMMQWVFMPPRIDGVPSAVLLTVSMRFILT